jgi:hypothetical protein
MPVFEAKDIIVRSEILGESSRGSILEIEFIGIHTHHWPENGSPVESRSRANPLNLPPADALVP